MDPLGDLRRLPDHQKALLGAGLGVAALSLVLYLGSRSGPSNACGLSCSQGTLVRLTTGQWVCAFKPIAAGQCVPPGTTDPAQLGYIAQPGGGVCVSNQPDAFLQSQAPPDCSTVVATSATGPYSPFKFSGGYQCCSRAGDCLFPAAAAIGC